MYFSAQNNFFSNQKHIMYGIVYFLILHIVLLFKPVHNCFTNVFEKIGRNTLGIYLIHSSVLPCVIKILRLIGNDNEIIYYVLFLGTYLLVIAISYLTTVLVKIYVEKTFFSLIER